MLTGKSKIKKLGILAGSGQLPFVIARKAREKGIETVAVGFKGMVSPLLKDEVNYFNEIPLSLLLTCLKTLKDQRADEVVLCGYVDHRIVFKEEEKDKLVQAILAQKDKRAESLLGRVTSEIAAEGLKVADMRDYLGDHLVKEGILTKNTPGQEKFAEIEHGWPIARQISELNIGQTIMIKDGVILAVEAIEGTDQMIKRTKEFGIKGSSVIKLPVHNKNPRFDLPVFGSNTIKAMLEVGADTLAVAAEQTIIIDPVECLQLAEESNISIIAKPLNWK